MAGFKTLKDVSTEFDAYLRQLTDKLFCAQIGQTPESLLGKKLENLKIISSKYRLMHAKETASTLQIAERVQNGANVLPDYEEAVQKRVLDEAIIKSVTRNHAVKVLLTTPDSQLRPDLVAKKQNIKARLQRLAVLDNELDYHNTRLQESRLEHEDLRAQWDTVLDQLRDTRASAAPDTQDVEMGTDYEKMKKTMSLLENIRLIMGPLLLGRTKYDWHADPNNFLALFATTREPNTVASFLSEC